MKEKVYDSTEVDELIMALRAIEASSNYAVDREVWLTDGPTDDDIEKILTLADNVLITTAAKPNYTTMQILSYSGFTVSPGEVDSFGWLTGIIQTSKGKIVFG